MAKKQADMKWMMYGAGNGANTIRLEWLHYGNYSAYTEAITCFGLGFLVAMDYGAKELKDHQHYFQKGTAIRNL
jgi:hypothetical protein